MNYLSKCRPITERPKIDLYLQLFNGHALIEQPFGQAVMAGRGGHGQLWGQRDECIQVDGAAVGRRPQQRQVRLTRCQERKKSLDDRKWDRENGGYLTPARGGWERGSTWVIAWDFCVVLFHSMGINRLGWSIYWHRSHDRSQWNQAPTRWNSLMIISARTSLDVFFWFPAGNFFRVSAHLEAEEGKSGVIFHQYSESGVEIGPNPLAWYRPAPQLQTGRERRIRQRRQRQHCVLQMSWRRP